MKLNSILGDGAKAFVNVVHSNNKSEHYIKAEKANNGQISFNDELHEYRNVKSNEVYISVTTFIGQYQKKFHNEYWSLYKALEVIVSDSYGKQYWYAVKNKLKSFRVNDNEDEAVVYMHSFIEKNKLSHAYAKAEHFKQQWKEKSNKALEKGTNYHNAKEAESYETGYDTINSLRVPTALTYSFDLSKLEDGFHAELLLYNDYYKVSGKADKIIIQTINGKRLVYIDDYKTNENIKKKNEFQTFKSPLEHLDDCDWNKYKLQLTMYGVLLELAGYEVVHTQLTHVTPFGEFPEPFDMMRKEVYTILDERANKLYS